MNFAIIGFLVLLFIGFLVVIWKALPNWRWYQILGAVMTMILSIVFLFPTAASLKARNAWHKVKIDLEKRLASAETENRRIQNGDPSDPTAPRGLKELRRELNKAGLDAGRHWFGLRNGGQDAATIQLAKAQPAAPAIPGEPAPAAADDAAAAGPQLPLIEQGMIVYGFAESNIQGADQPLPTFYLGEYTVTASTPDRVTLQPTSALEQNQIDRIRNGQAVQWSLYELLPLDAHEPFIADGSVADEDNIFGRVDDALVNGLLRTPDRNPNIDLEQIEITEENYAAVRAEFEAKTKAETKDAYLRDGKAETGIAPENRWVKVEFAQNHTIIVDSPDKRSALDGSFFDGSGRAVDSRLQRNDGGKVAFKKGEQIVVKGETAKEWIDTGIAELKNTYYVRTLNDYRFLQRKAALSLIELQNRKIALEYEIKSLEATLKSTESMSVRAQESKEKLEQDRDQFVVERKVIDGYHKKLQEGVSTEKRLAARLYQDNHRLEQTIQKAFAGN